MSSFTLSGNIVDLYRKRIFPGKITVSNERIQKIEELEDSALKHFILPGFIDAHVHIESSLLIPSEFARLAVPHGTVATVSDPHEIGNVLGLEGVRYMIENARLVPFHFYFGAPSCVPATSFETSGATISAKEIHQLFEEEGLHYLSEMMNYPGVLNKDPEVMEKIAVAKKFNKPIDGHAPGLKGMLAKKYADAGITTDHECFSLPEALDKIKAGMKILIREGSAAKNFDALHSLLYSHPASCMFCSDDKHPHELVKGHINEIVKRAISEHGYHLMNVLSAASLNPIKHYQLDVGCLQERDFADFIVVNNLIDFSVLKTYIRGNLVAENGKTFISPVKSRVINHFFCREKKREDFLIAVKGKKIRVIVANDGQLVTETSLEEPVISKGFAEANPSKDLLKLAVVCRYVDAPPAIAFIKGFKLKEGAIASCIAHDSHNIIAVGTNDMDIADAVNVIIEHQGGISCACNGEISHLSLPVGGIMSPEDGYQVADAYAKLDKQAKKLGSTLDAPFMTLSFMALLVIPSLKLSDKGLFDGSTFNFTSLFSND